MSGSGSEPGEIDAGNTERAGEIYTRVKSFHRITHAVIEAAQIAEGREITKLSHEYDGISAKAVEVLGVIAGRVLREEERQKDDRQRGRRESDLWPIDAPGGYYVDHFVEALGIAADATGRTFRGRHADITFDIAPGMTAEETHQAWREAMASRPVPES